MRKLFRLRVLVVVAVVALVLTGGIAAYAYVFGVSDGTAADADVAVAAPTTTTEPPSTTTTRARAPRPTTTTTIPLPAQPDIVILPAPPPGGLAQGASSDVVLAYEYRLKSVAFDPGPVDGVFDQATRYAIETVQKLFGMPRTGRIDEPVRFALSAFRWPRPLALKAERNRVEIDLDRQVLVLWKNARIALITTTSTGSGRRFCGGDDGCQYATTPAGRFAFTWHHDGWRKGSLGMLYNPYYFNGGQAVHGYASVPVYPASHGCARIPMHIAEYFPSLVWKDMPVYVVGTPAGPYGAAPGGPPVATPPPATTTVPVVTTAPVATTTAAATTTTATTAPATTTTTRVATTTTPTTAPATTAPATTTTT